MTGMTKVTKYISERMRYAVLEAVSDIRDSIPRAYVKKGDDGVSSRPRCPVCSYESWGMETLVIVEADDLRSLSSLDGAMVVRCIECRNIFLLMPPGSTPASRGPISCTTM